MKTEHMDERRGLPSASRAWLYAACSGSYRLMRQAGEQHEDGDGSAAFGTRVHALLADRDGDTRIASTQATQEECEIADKCRALRAGDMPFDPVEVHIEERMFSTSCDFTGKPDYAAISGKGLYLVDYKTGTWSKQTLPEQNEQLMVLVALCHENYGIIEGKASIIQPRHRPQVMSWNFFPKDVFAAQAWMNDLAAKVNETEPTRTPGDHCKWCPARHACPEGTNWATSLLPSTATPQTIEAAVNLLTPQQLAKVWEKKAAALKVFEAIDDRLKAMSEQELAAIGLRLQPGSVREVITKPHELFRQCYDLGMDTELFLSCVDVNKSRFRDAVAAATKLTGNTLSSAVDRLLMGVTESKQNAPSIKKV